MGLAMLTNHPHFLLFRDSKNENDHVSDKKSETRGGEDPGHDARARRREQVRKAQR
jgi:hypothetical protein